ncbi:MAG: hypothetical protein KGJ23_00170 [Euryarchaeota archaeon]|nr:hypothetical protein [Euryarchaeota archaeon]
MSARSYLVEHHRNLDAGRSTLVEWRTKHVNGLRPRMVDLVTQIVHLVFGLVQLFVATGLAGLAIYLGISIPHKATLRVPLMEELKNGNVAMAIMLVWVFNGISIVLQAGVLGLVQAVGA